MTALEMLAWAALNQVMDPELDEPITDLGFVRSVEATDDGHLTVHLRLPTSFCSPNFAYLMAGDAKDLLSRLPDAASVVVELDDHHDSGLINAGLAADAGYRGTFGAEAEDSLDELRLTFRRKAHTAAMERALSQEGMDVGARLGDLPDTPLTAALIRRREDLGLTVAPGDPVLVDDEGRPYPAPEAEFRLRRARSTRISIDGNAHFCRGLLRTRYPGSEADQAPRADERFLLPLAIPPVAEAS
ncbi:metal-sulfur cluster assembly factor [Kineosporia succinea]|uniref:Metal-sulfur cluster biosynthetic enzyme n=1 Tax=Kineosporia succinea TaxID=84632 RepID=A0ABT9P8Y3_9ACTN|nr:iron-sulfur cluster assembly protein [Kineosporia succinea]MDP9829162.1 metal-sulfur cluster biosynthetic enzyme [Kineosporia succinea]